MCCVVTKQFRFNLIVLKEALQVIHTRTHKHKHTHTHTHTHTHREQKREVLIHILASTTKHWSETAAWNEHHYSNSLSWLPKRSINMLQSIDSRFLPSTELHTVSVIAAHMTSSFTPPGFTWCVANRNKSKHNDTHTHETKKNWTGTQSCPLPALKEIEVTGKEKEKEKERSGSKDFRAIKSMSCRPS